MATSFATAQAYTSPPSSQIQLYGSQQPSPSDSGSNTPTNASPTSPQPQSKLNHLPLQTRQLRPPKSPLYVPAVLRPTERPVRQSPLTPPRSAQGSWDSNSDDGKLMMGRRLTVESAKFAGLGSVIETEWAGDEGFGKITGLPTRNHWKVNQDARFHPGGSLSRACDICYHDYVQWEAARRSRSNSESSETSTQPPVGIGGPGINVRARGHMGGALGDRVGSFQGSVPKDWNWSTF
ncbi:MAG: hypothetical protein M1819_006245 [Sarea resinae]|nr:MAG: hypothetical protein M1819_006245 [Sarea resinae]